MKPRPLSRSITFWSGILVMGFILFAWWHSADNWQGMFRGPWGASNAGSGFSFGFNRARGGQPLGFWSESVPGSASFESRIFPRPLFARGEDVFVSREELMRKIDEAPNMNERILASVKHLPRTDWEIFIPHWLLLLAIALSWAGLLLWRARRMRRAWLGSPVAA